MNEELETLINYIVGNTEDQHETTNNPHYDYKELWYVPSREEYEENKDTDEFYEGNREVQFHKIFGEEAYETFSLLNKPVEYKTEGEHNHSRNSNVYIETEQCFLIDKDDPEKGYTEPKPSGINISTSKVWIHHLFDENNKPYLPFVIPTETLRKWIKENDFYTTKSDHEMNSKTRNYGVLIPIQFILQHYPIPHVNGDYVNKLVERGLEETQYNKNIKERERETYKRLFMNNNKTKGTDNPLIEQQLNGKIKVTYTNSNGELSIVEYEEGFTNPVIIK